MSKKYTSYAEWYAALDQVVAEISEREGSQPIAKNYESGGHVAYADWIHSGEDGESFLAVILSDEIPDCEQMRFPIIAKTSAAERPTWWSIDPYNDDAMLDDERTWAWGPDVADGEPSVAHLEESTGLYTLYTLGRDDVVRG